MEDLRTDSPDNVVTFRGAHAGQARRRGQRDLPLGPGLPSTIARLEEIAEVSGDHLVTEGPVHPDHRLLDLCAAALHLLRQAEGFDGVLKTEGVLGRPLTAAERARHDVAFDQASALAAAAVKLMKRARVLHASTPAGIYAKALLVQASLTGAAQLGRSLAADLISCQALRQSLTWPDAEREARP